jgi:hypothetical protein
VADIKQRVAEFARDHHLFADGIRELDGIIEQASAEACSPQPYAELVADYPKLALRISPPQWEAMPIAAQREWALHQATHAWSLFEFQSGTIKAYADHVDGLRERIGLMEQRLAGATERKEAAEKRVAELERQVGAMTSANTVLRQKREEADERISELEAALDYEGAKATAKHAQSVIDEKNARISELEAALRQIAGGGPPCAGNGPDKDDDGTPYGASTLARVNQLHKMYCKRCIAQAALAQKGGE